MSMNTSIVSSNSLRALQNAFDLTRCFVHSGEPAVDTSFFEFQTLSLPLQIPDFFPTKCSTTNSSFEEMTESFKNISIENANESLLFAGFCEDYWNENSTTEETKLHSLQLKSDSYVKMNI